MESKLTNFFLIAYLLHVPYNYSELFLKLLSIISNGTLSQNGEAEIMNPAQTMFRNKQIRIDHTRGQRKSPASFLMRASHCSNQGNILVYTLCK